MPKSDAWGQLCDAFRCGRIRDVNFALVPVSRSSKSKSYHIMVVCQGSLCPSLKLQSRALHSLPSRLQTLPSIIYRSVFSPQHQVLCMNTRSLLLCLLFRAVLLAPPEMANSFSRFICLPGMAMGKVWQRCIIVCDRQRQWKLMTCGGRVVSKYCSGMYGLSPAHSKNRD